MSLRTVPAASLSSRIRSAVLLQWVGAAAAGVEVLDEDGAGVGAVAHPQFGAATSVGGREEQGAVDVRLAAVVAGVAAGVEVLDEDGAGIGAIAHPQFGAVGP